MIESSVQEPASSAAHESQSLGAGDARSVRTSEFRGPLLVAAQGGSSLVGVAVDTIIAGYRVNPADALDLLLKASHYRVLLSVAGDVIADGRLPDEAMIRARHQQCAERRLSQADSPPTSLLNDRPTRPVDRVLGASWTLGGIHEAP